MKYQIAWSLLAVMAVGCGEVTPKEEPDGGNGPDAPAGDIPVKVQVLGIDASGRSTGIADPNAVAIFTAADGTIAKQGPVGPQGDAEASMSQGGTVQTLQVRDVSATSKAVYIMTFHDVKPGDVVKSGPPRSLPDQRGLASTMTGTFTASTGYEHRFQTDCGAVTSAGPTVALSLYPNCRGTTVEMLATQTPSTQPSRLLPRFLAMSIPFVAGGPFTVSGNWTDMDLFTVALTNTPEDISEISFNRWTQLRAGASARVANQSFTTATDPPAGTVSASLRYPQGVGKRAVVSVALRKGTGVAQQQIDVQTQDVGNAQGIDATELPVPWISATRLSVADRKLSWTETGGGAPDLRIGFAIFNYTRDGIDYAVTHYDFSAPSATPSITFSGLSSQYAEFDPAQQTVAVTGGIGLVGYVDQSNIDGYSQARTQGFNLVSAAGSIDAYTDQAYHRRTTLASVLQ